jgi:hypothetical protein
MTPEELELLTNHISTNVLKIINQHQHSPDFIMQTIQGVQMGLGNVYSEFKDLEKRQLEIEALLRGTDVPRLNEVFITNEAIRKMLEGFNHSASFELKKHIDRLKNDLHSIISILDY